MDSIMDYSFICTYMKSTLPGVAGSLLLDLERLEAVPRGEAEVVGEPAPTLRGREEGVLEEACWWCRRAQSST